MVVIMTSEEIEYLHHELALCVRANEQDEANRIYRQLINIGRPLVEIMQVLADTANVKELPTAFTPKTDSQPPPEQPASGQTSHRLLNLTICAGIGAVACVGFFWTVRQSTVFPDSPRPDSPRIAISADPSGKSGIGAASEAVADTASLLGTQLTSNKAAAANVPPSEKVLPAPTGYLSGIATPSNEAVVAAAPISREIIALTTPLSLAQRPNQDVIDNGAAAVPASSAQISPTEAVAYRKPSLDMQPTSDKAESVDVPRPHKAEPAPTGPLTIPSNGAVVGAALISTTPIAPAAPLSPAENQNQDVFANGAAAAPASPLQNLAPPRISEIVSRGDEVFRIGDIASARLYYERAADAGDGQAALRLGQTYDPLFLVRVGFKGMPGNLKLALQWYRTARELGVNQAEVLLTDPQRN